jgi:hypothetical protein
VPALQLRGHEVSADNALRRSRPRPPLRRELKAKDDPENFSTLNQNIRPLS